VNHHLPPSCFHAPNSFRRAFGRLALSALCLLFFTAYFFSLFNCLPPTVLCLLFSAWQRGACSDNIVRLSHASQAARIINPAAALLDPTQTVTRARGAGTL
ncbi:MAG TPA: hypothetical protein VGV38_18560, partial [Pyrinomonadaceae bacterium]|nr:hypothetical protein [Pyrinomonadaceae bacterium]